MMTRDAIVAAARACVGARFRPWGRDPALGLDCVGLAAAALEVSAPRGYALRGGDPEEAAAEIAATGLVAIAQAEAGAGDLLLVDEGQAQMHLAVLTERGFVHADAGLRRVVETPGRPERPVLGAWRREG